MDAAGCLRWASVRTHYAARAQRWRGDNGGRARSQRRRTRRQRDGDDDGDGDGDGRRWIATRYGNGRRRERRRGQDDDHVGDGDGDGDALFGSAMASAIACARLRTQLYSCCVSFSTRMRSSPQRSRMCCDLIARRTRASRSQGASPFGTSDSQTSSSNAGSSLSWAISSGSFSGRGNSRPSGRRSWSWSHRSLYRWMEF